MPKRLEIELRDLKERFGIALGDLTADELEKFVLACRRIENPFSTVNMELIERPFRICEGVYGYPMTVGAVVWLMEFVNKWWPTGAMNFWAQCYAMIHARDEGAFPTEKTAAKWVIFRTSCCLTCHKDELSAALSRAYGQTENLTTPPDAHSKEVSAAQEDYAAVIARLEVHSGIPAKVWLWEKTFMQTMRCYADLHAFAATFSVGKFKHMRDELDEAVNDLARFKMQILENHKRLNAEEGAAA